MKSFNRAALSSRTDRLLRDNPRKPDLTLANRALRPGADAFASIPSLDTMEGDTSRKDSPRYSGSAVLGIATTHKSNAVPVTSREQAVDIANMRRNNDV